MQERSVFLMNGGPRDDRTRSNYEAQNPHFKSVCQLRDRRHRRQQQRILIDGRREIQRALRGRVRLLELFFDAPAWQGPELQSWLPSLADQGVRLIELPERLLAKLSYGERRDGVVAVAETPVRSLHDLRLSPRPLLAVLQGMEKPGNVGAMIRTADGAGVDAILVVDGMTDLFNPNVIRASLGTVFTGQVCAESSEKVQAWLVEHRTQVCVARLDASLAYDRLDYTGPTAFVLGSEAHGVSADWVQPAYQGVKLPMLGSVDSLNVSATAAVLLYEAQRQRRKLAGDSNGVDVDPPGGV